MKNQRKESLMKLLLLVLLIFSLGDSISSSAVSGQSTVLFSDNFDGYPSTLTCSGPNLDCSALPNFGSGVAPYVFPHYWVISSSHNCLKATSDPADTGCVTWGLNDHMGPNSIAAVVQQGIEGALPPNGGSEMAMLGASDLYADKTAMEVWLDPTEVNVGQPITFSVEIWLSAGIDNPGADNVLNFLSSFGQLRYYGNLAGTAGVWQITANEVDWSDVGTFHLATQTWHSISYTVSGGHYVNLIVDGEQIFNLSQYPTSGEGGQICGPYTLLSVFVVPYTDWQSEASAVSHGFPAGFYAYVDNVQVTLNAGSETSSTTISTTDSTINTSINDTVSGTVEGTTSSTSTSSTCSGPFATSTQSTTLSTTTGSQSVTGTMSTTSTVTGPTAGTSTASFTSILSTITTTNVTVSTVGETTTQTGVITVDTSTSNSTTLSATTYETATVSGTTAITETDTFNVLLTTIFEELRQFLDTFMQLIEYQPVVTPVGQQVNQVVVTVTTPTSSTTSDTFITIAQKTTAYASVAATTTTVGSSTSTSSQLPVITNTISTSTTVTGPVAGTMTTIFTSLLSTSYSTTSTGISSSESATETGATTTGIVTETTTSTATMLSSTTSAGTLSVTETDTFNVLVTQIFQELDQFEAFILQTVGFQVTATPLGQQVDQVVVTVTTPTTSTTSSTTVTSSLTTTSSAGTTTSLPSTFTVTSTLSATTLNRVVTQTVSTRTTTTGAAAGKSTTTFTSILSTATSTSMAAISTGSTAVPTATSVGTVSATSTSSATTLGTTTVAGTVTVSQAETFTTFLTTIIQMLTNFANEVLKVLGTRQVVTPKGEKVIRVVVTKK